MALERSNSCVGSSYFNLHSGVQVEVDGCGSAKQSTFSINISVLFQGFRYCHAHADIHLWHAPNRREIEAQVSKQISTHSGEHWLYFDVKL